MAARHIGMQLGNYRVLGVKGHGGMGTVYEAEHVQLGRRAAVKVLHPDLAADPTVTQRFFREAKAAASVEDPGVVDVLDFGIADSGDAYLVMEYLPGVSLAEVAAGPPLAEAEVVRIGRQAAATLAATHARGIVHRDLKPSNILLIPDAAAIGGNRVKIVDFGVAKLERATTEVTKTGVVVGTPRYMSPEQCRGEADLDGRSDIYSLGCVLYRIACGVSAIDEKTMQSAAEAHHFHTPKAPREIRPELSPAFERLLLAMLAKRRELRPASMTAVVEALEAIAPPMISSTPSSSATPELGASATLPAPALDVSIQATPTPIPPRRSRALYGVALLLVAGAGVSIAIALSGSASKVTPPPSTAIAPPPIALAATTTPDAAVDAPAAVSIELSSTPSGARVIRDAREVGTTPLALELDRSDEPVAFTFELDGHQPVTLEVIPNQGRAREAILPALARPAPKKTPPPKRKPKESGFGETINPL
jgi:serine/threonine-protein kinase